MDGLTLLEVAAALDTGQASLYRHIADRQECTGRRGRSAPCTASW
ncbi:hypothetical protein [Kutzneria sp. NPDC051319]